MSRKLITRLLGIVLMVTLLGTYSPAFAQTDVPTPDTVYHDCFGCDSFLLTANNIVYYSDTVIAIPHRVVAPSIIYIDVVNIYQITIGRSYNVRDTTQQTVCRNKLPYAYHGNFYTESGDYWVDFPSSRGCDSAHTLLQLQVLNGQHDTIDLALCYGQPSVSYEDLVFTSPGCFTFDLGVDTNGCSVDVTYRVTQYPLTSDSMNITICSNELPYYFMGHRIDSAGVYEVHYINAVGCDAILYVNVTVNPSQVTTQTINAMVCASELPYVVHGRSFNGPTSETFIVPNQYGCDSLKVSLTLAVTYPYTDTVSHYLCAEEFPYVHDSLHVYDKPGSYYINDSANSTTCISFTLLQLFQYPSVHDTLTICTPDSSYTFGDTTFTTSTVYTYTDTNSYQCLDYHTLRINLLQQMAYDTLDVTVCASNMPYSYMGETFTTAGDYPVILQNQQGCDSVTILLRLTVQQNLQVVTAKTITRNDIPYMFRGKAYSQSGIYTEIAPAVTDAECDTSYVLVLNVTPIYTVEIDTTVCANTPVVFLGETITTAGPHNFTYHLSGYDSVITLMVYHNPVYRAETVYAEVGEYDLPYHFVDSAYYTAGYHERVLSTVDGCDSVLSVFLTINAAIVNTDTINKEICSNDLPLTLYDSVLTHAGVYRYIVPSSIPAVDSVFFVNLTVKESPTLVIADTTYLCAGSTVTLAAQSTGSVYLWNNGSTESSISVTLAGQYSVTVSNAFDCSTSATVQVIGVELPDARISGRTTVCEGSSLTLVATGGTEYRWSEGTVSDTLVVTPTESTTYWVTVTNKYGCSKTKDVAVTVNLLPVLTILGDDDICQGESTTFTAYGAESYHWSNGGRLDRITVNTEGLYTVTGTDANQCQSTASVTLVVHSLPILKINGRTTFCQGGTTTVTATGASHYEWNSGDVTQTITASYAGQYTVTGTDQFGCSSSKSVTITQASVNANISGNRYFCHGQSTTLTVSGDNGNTYQWFDGSTNSSIAISNAGQYSVTVTNAVGCQNVLSATVNEYNLSAPVISGSLTICEGQSTTLRASGGVSYVWDDGTEQPLITVNATGTYSVTSTNSYGCTATTSATVLVNPAPMVTILAQDAICKGDDVSISAITNANTFHWNTGQNTATINVSPMINTTYTVLVTDENGCNSTASTLVNVKTLPAVYISGQNSVCQGDTATLTATGGESYQWNTGQFTPTLQVTNSGTYSVVATGSNGCTATAQAAVTVHSLPIATVTEVAEICRGQQTTLMTDAPAGCTYLWSNGSRQSRITVSEAGEYQVTVTNASHCSQIYSSSVTVHEIPQISITGNTDICEGQSTVLTVSGDNSSEYLWSNGDNNTSTSVSAPGQYSVVATNQYGCTATASRNVTVHQLPEPQITGNLTICLGESTTLNVTGGTSYTWSTGETGAQLTVAPTFNQTYSVTASNAFGCVAGTSATVTVNMLPVISFSGNTSVCAGSTTSILATGGTNYTWSNGSQTASMTTGNAGLYYVTVTNAQGCSNKDSIRVKVNQNPQVQISGSSYVCAGNITTLSASGANTYLWSTQDITPNITVNPTIETTYTVTGTDTNGCHSTVSKVLNVEPLPTIQVLGARTICAGQSTTLTATGGSKYVWSTQDTINSIVVNPTQSQSYVVTVTNAYGCVSSSAVTVTVNALPQLTFNGNTTVCAGNTTTITAIGANTYSWSTGAQTANINVSQPGVYYVTASNAQNCSKTDSVQVVVNPKPQVQIAGSNHLCSGTIATLTASGASSYHWSTDEVSAEISISPTSNTVYTVTGYDTNGCYTTVQKVVNVEDVPVVQILGERTICQGQSSVLTAMGGTSYLWSNGSSTQDIAVFPNMTTTYTVTAYNDFGCSATSSAIVNVNMLPSIIFSGNTFICQGQSTTITVSGGNTYAWSTGATGSSITVSSPGVYHVNVMNTMNCMRSDSIEVVVWNNPILSVSGSSLICEGDTASLNVSGADVYSWSTGEVGPTVSVMPEQTTTYNVVGYDANGCSTTVSKVVNVESAPDVYISGELSICHGQSTTLTASDAAAYAWSTGATGNSITVSAYGNYTVTATSVNGCRGQASVTIVDKPLPVFTVHGVSTLCDNTTAVLSVEGDNTYAWNTGSTDTAITISAGGLYTVTATNSYGCDLSSSIYVSQLNAPVLSIMGVNELCQGDSTMLMAITDAQQYLWSTGETQQAVMVVPDNTTYSVTVTGDNGCTSSAERQITSLPTYDQIFTASICEHNSYSGYGFDIPVMDTAGVYTFTRTLQSVSGCDSIVNLELTVNPLPRLDTINGPQNITQYGNSSFAVNNPQFVDNYEWRVSNPHWVLSNATYPNVTLSVSTNGSGVLYARGINGCGYTDISLEIYCNVGIEDHLTQTMVKLYPNPVHQSLYIDMDESADVAKVALFNEAGRLVYQTDCNDTHIEINCTRFANGHYTVQFLDEKGRRVESRKIVVKNK